MGKAQRLHRGAQPIMMTKRYFAMKCMKCWMIYLKQKVEVEWGYMRMLGIIVKRRTIEKANLMTLLRKPKKMCTRIANTASYLVWCICTK
ncbi:hypothetical protein Hanom_Chr00s113045g01808441 [Helianthus anomalus]